MGVDIIDGIKQDLSEQRRTVSEQGQILAVLASSIGEIKSYMKESIEIQREQAVLFEKFTNHEERNSGEHDHIHKRIDDVEGDIKTLKFEHKTACDTVRPMAEKRARIHGGMVFTAKAVGTLVIGMLFSMVLWLIAMGGA